jgi:hypothetical protein
MLGASRHMNAAAMKVVGGFLLLSAVVCFGVAEFLKTSQSRGVILALQLVAAFDGVLGIGLLLAGIRKAEAPLAAIPPDKKPR